MAKQHLSELLAMMCKSETLFYKIQNVSNGLQAETFLFVINPKAHKNQLVFQLQNFLFHRVTEVMI